MICFHVFISCSNVFPVCPSSMLWINHITSLLYFLITQNENTRRGRTKCEPLNVLLITIAKFSDDCGLGNILILLKVWYLQAFWLAILTVIVLNSHLTLLLSNLGTFWPFAHENCRNYSRLFSEKLILRAFITAYCA